MDQSRISVFIVGMGRSGTTLLSMMLNSHSMIAIAPETHYFARFLNSRRYGLTDELQTVISDLQIDPEQFFSKIEKLDNHSHAAVFQLMLTMYAESRNKMIWGEKTPHHLLFVPEIKRYFPSSKIIHIVRDPRDVSLSLRNVPWNKGSILNHATSWNAFMRLSDVYKSRYQSDFLEVKYENLVKDPQQVLAEITDFLGVPFESQIITDFRKNPNFQVQKEPWKKRTLDNLDGSNVSKWTILLSDEAKLVFHVVSARWMRSRGYALDVGNLKFATIRKASALAFEDFNLREMVGLWRRTIGASMALK